MEIPMVTPRTRLIAGVSVPDSPLLTEVIEYAQKLSEPYLFNHAMRSWLFAAKIGHLKAIDCDHEVIAVGTILHDIGLTDGVSGSNRFEVNGAIHDFDLKPGGHTMFAHGGNHREKEAPARVSGAGAL